MISHEDAQRTWASLCKEFRDKRAKAAASIPSSGMVAEELAEWSRLEAEAEEVKERMDTFIASMPER